MTENISVTESMREDSRLSTRSVARDSMYYGIGFAISRLASFILLPLYTRVLSPADYGVLQLLQVSLDVIEILLVGGLAAGVIRLYNGQPDEPHRRRFLAGALLAIVMSRAVGAGVALSFAPQLSRLIFDTGDYSPHVRMAAVNFFVGGLSLVPMLHLQATRNARLYTFASTGGLLAQLLLNVFFVLFLGKGVLGVLFAAFLGSLSVGIPVLVRFVRHVSWPPKWVLIKQLWQFGAPYQIAAIATFILGFGDRYFLNARSAVEVGLYGLASQFGLLLSSLALAPFLKAYEPVVYQLAELSPPERNARINANFLILNLLMVLAGLTLSLLAEPVLRIMSAPAFHSAAVFVPLLVLAYVIRAWGDFFRLGLNVTGDTQYVLYATWAGAIVSLLLFAWLIPPFGGWGAAVATVVGFGIRSGALYRYAQRAWPVGWDLVPTGNITALAVVTTVAWTALKPTSVVLQLVGAVTLLGMVTSIIWFRLLPSRMRDGLHRETSAVMSRWRLKRTATP